MIQDVTPGMPMPSEEHIQRQIVDWLKYQYHDVMFYTTLDGMKLTKAQAGKAKHFRNPASGWPDLYIAEPVGQYHGLYIELKKDDVQLRRTNGLTKLLKGDTHIRQPGEWWDLHTETQAALHDRLRQRNYAVSFACGFDKARSIIEAYFKGKVIDGVVPVPSNTKRLVITDNSGGVIDTDVF